MKAFTVEGNNLSVFLVTVFLNKFSQYYKSITHSQFEPELVMSSFGLFYFFCLFSLAKKAKLLKQEKKNMPTLKSVTSWDTFPVQPITTVCSILELRKIYLPAKMLLSVK